MSAQAFSLVPAARRNPLARFPVGRRMLPGLGELARAMRAQRGLGDCPPGYPYLNSAGGCSNVPEEIDANAYFQTGGQLSDNGTIVGWTGDSGPTIDCPAGTTLNPFTGRVECVDPTAAALLTASGYVPRASNDRSVMDQIAAAAVAAGRARGFNISCASVPIGGDPITNEQRYAAECTVNGSPGHDASVLLTPGGNWETLATEVGVSPIFQSSGGYQYVPPTSQQSAYAQYAAATSPNRSAALPPAPSPGGYVPIAPASAAQPSKPATTGAQTFSDVASSLDNAVDQAQAAIGASGVPSWVWLAGAGAIGLYLLGGRK